MVDELSYKKNVILTIYWPFDFQENEKNKTKRRNLCRVHGFKNKNKYRVSNSATGGAAIKFLSKLPTEIYHLKIHLFIRRFHI